MIWIFTSALFLLSLGLFCEGQVIKDGENPVPCQTINNQTGVCVNLRKHIKYCPSLLKLYDEMKWEELRQHFCVPRGSLIAKICCPFSEYKKVPGQSKEPNFALHKNYNLLPVNECGIAAGDVGDRIIGGVSAVPGQFPWMARLGFKDPSRRNTYFLCGASIINKRYILTAAHCFKEREYELSTIRLAQTNEDEAEECIKDCDGVFCKDSPKNGILGCSSPQEFRPEDVLIHPGYQYETASKDDIALIRLDRDINITNSFPDRTLRQPVEVEGALGFLLPGKAKGITPLIVGGREATPHAYPHQISLQVRSGSSWYHSCGGSIAGADKIITAAHCIYGQSASNLRVVAGDHDLFASEGTEQTANVRTATRHPSYNPSNYDYDYAVLRLSSSFTLNNNVRAIALASAGSEPSGTCTNTGWGNTRGDGGVTNPARLQTVNLPAVSRTTCAQRYQGVNSVTARMVCAGAAGQGPCNGDSGGPLVCGGALAGIVSWGMQPCAQSQYPGVFSNVAAARSWLDGQ